MRVVQKNSWKDSDAQNVDALLVEKTGTGERNMFSSKNSYAPNVMKKEKTLEFPIQSLTEASAR